MAIFPWSRDLWKTFKSSQYAIELCDTASTTWNSAYLEITFPFNCRSNAWNQAYHCTHGICKCTIWMVGTLFAHPSVSLEAYVDDIGKAEDVAIAITRMQTETAMNGLKVQKTKTRLWFPTQTSIENEPFLCTLQGRMGDKTAGAPNSSTFDGMVPWFLSNTVAQEYVPHDIIRERIQRLEQNSHLHFLYFGGDGLPDVPRMLSYHQGWGQPTRARCKNHHPHFLPRNKRYVNHVNRFFLEKCLQLGTGNVNHANHLGISFKTCCFLHSLLLKT